MKHDEQNAGYERQRELDRQAIELMRFSGMSFADAMVVVIDAATALPPSERSRSADAPVERLPQSETHQ